MKHKMNETVITTTGLMEILTQIDELADYDITVSDDSNGDITISIGDSVYNVSPSETVEVPDEVVEDLAEINDDVYEQSEYADDEEYISSGVMKEVAKTLLVGGLVRLASKFF